MKHPDTSRSAGGARRGRRAAALVAGAALAGANLVAAGPGASAAAADGAPRAVVAGTLGYVSNGNDNTVSVINPVNNTVFTTISGAFNNPQHALAAPNGSGIFVANLDGDTVTVIDPYTNAVTANVTVGNGPYGMSFNTSGSRAYVTASGAVYVIDTGSDTVVDTITGFSNPSGTATNADGSTLYVSDYDTNSVDLVNTATHTISSIPVGANPYALVANPDGSAIYVANRSSNTVSVISTSTNAVTANIPVGAGPGWLATNPSGTRLYAVDDNDVTVIDTTDNQVVTTLTSGLSGPDAIAFNQSGSAYYITNYSGDDVTVFDAATDTATGSIPVGNQPQGVTFNPGSPSFGGLSSNHGPLGGGNSITITGTGFGAATGVNFGAPATALTRAAADSADAAATAFTVNSATSITATVPPGSGVVDVTVTTPTGTSATTPADRYSYDAADLAVSVSAAPASSIVSSATAALGSYTAFTVTITNNGPTLLANDTTATLALAGPLVNLLSARVVSSPTGGTGCIPAGTQINCTLYIIPPGSSAVLRVLAEPQILGAPIMLSATAKASAPDPNLGNNTASTSATTSNANNCSYTGTPGNDNALLVNSPAVCGLGGNDTLTTTTVATTARPKIYLGSGTDRYTSVVGSNSVIYGGYGRDTINVGPDFGDTIYAGDYLYPGDFLHPGAAPDIINAGPASTCYITSADHQSGCGRVIVK